MTPLPTLCAAAALACCGAAQATLHDRGGGLVYDDFLDVTWLMDANYAQTSGFDADGLMDWQQARTWAANLDYVDTVRGTTWSDWRLPTVRPLDGSAWDLQERTDGTSDWGYNITSAQHEMAHLFHVSLGNLSSFRLDGSPRPGISGTEFGMARTGPFVNLVGTVYWYGTDSPFNPGTHAASFLGFSGGDLGNSTIDSLHHALALRNGDVGLATAVPEPGAWSLLLAGLCAVTGVARRRGARA